MLSSHVKPLLILINLTCVLSLSRSDCRSSLSNLIPLLNSCCKSIQKQMRRVLVDMRARRMTPTSLNLATMNAATSSLGTATLPTQTTSQPTPPSSWVSGDLNGTATVVPNAPDLPNMNYQEARLERDAWRGIAESLAKLKTLQNISGSTKALTEDDDDDDMDIE